jgi:serine/threonine-protein kinase RsbW
MAWLEARPLDRRDLLLRLQLNSNPEILCVVRSAVSQLSEELGFSAEECRAVTRAVDEALTNVIRHAYNGKRGRPIELSCRRIHDPADGGPREALEILLEDHGVAADPKKMRSRPLDDIRPGGLGIHFIQQSVDLMEYKRIASTNRLRLLKYLRPVKQEIAR